ncbi:Pentatricopeptide repeat-containing protein -chloroplastic [Striga hermonthica]|uniref:Pentatricopeptide repeat-containing protein -chloroplastic n=1 Tax=Striga hermonthica TaxID=68872 RepID=A0A9N7P506_STRHE|nr:Pentatricopeptide repeat-containing protein -chloroplastic [Striga hermonthica]
MATHYYSPASSRYLAGAPKFSPPPANKTFSLRTLSTARGPPFTLPNWRSERKDPKTRELKLIDAFFYLERMVAKGHRPDPESATQLLYDLCKSKKSFKATRVMEMLVRSGSIPDAASYTFLVSSLCRRGNVGHAMQLFATMEAHGYPTDMRTYNSLIEGLCMNEGVDKLLYFVEKSIQKGGLVPNAFTFSILIKAACKEKGVDAAMSLLDALTSLWGVPNLVSYNVILKGLCSEGRVGEAIRLFRSLPDMGFSPNVISYNTLLRSLCDAERWEEANELLLEMDGGDRAPSLVTYNILIGSLSTHGLTDWALEVVDQLFGDGRFNPDADSYNPVLTRLCKERRVDAVLKCLDEMKSKNCIPNELTYCAIATLCNEGMVEEAFSIFQRLRAWLDPCGEGGGFYRNVVRVLCGKKKTEAALELLEQMVVADEGFEPESCTYSAIIRGLCFEGMVEAAVGVVRAMEEADVGHYNTLLVGLCKRGRTEVGLEVAIEMVEKGRMPTEATYAILVQGLVREGEKGLAAGLLKERLVRQSVRKSTAERLTMQYDLDAL